MVKIPGKTKPFPVGSLPEQGASRLLRRAWRIDAPPRRQRSSAVGCSGSWGSSSAARRATLRSMVHPVMIAQPSPVDVAVGRPLQRPQFLLFLLRFQVHTLCTCFSLTAMLLSLLSMSSFFPVSAQKAGVFPECDVVRTTFPAARPQIFRPLRPG